MVASVYFAAFGGSLFCFHAVHHHKCGVREGRHWWDSLAKRLQAPRRSLEPMLRGQDVRLPLPALAVALRQGLI
eukprot:3985532-Amphidinium_carterae.1